VGEDRLFETEGRAFFIAGTDLSEFQNLFLRITQRHPGAVIRMIRGKKSRTVQNFFDEISAALQFPYYFGENWAAFDECITDLDWIEGNAYLLMVNDANLFLSAADIEDFRICIRTFMGANSEWLTPNQFIPRERVPTPFHVLFQCQTSEIPELSRRLVAVGGEFEIMEPSTSAGR
jgi:Barstar (barnase inhibitor)